MPTTPANRCARPVGQQLWTLPRWAHDNDADRKRATIMGRLFDLIEHHREAQPYPPSYSRIAERVGVSRQTILNWRDPSKLPDTEHLRALAEAIGESYHRVLDAALIDTGYLEPPRPKFPPAEGSEQVG